MNQTKIAFQDNLKYRDISNLGTSSECRTQLRLGRLPSNHLSCGPTSVPCGPPVVGCRGGSVVVVLLARSLLSCRDGFSGFFSVVEDGRWFNSSGGWQGIRDVSGGEWGAWGVGVGERGGRFDGGCRDRGGWDGGGRGGITKNDLVLESGAKVVFLVDCFGFLCGLFIW